MHKKTRESPENAYSPSCAKPKVLGQEFHRSGAPPPCCCHTAHVEPIVTGRRKEPNACATLCSRTGLRLPGRGGVAISECTQHTGHPSAWLSHVFPRPNGDAMLKGAFAPG